MLFELSRYGKGEPKLRQVSVALTNAQIKTMPTTPVTIVPAQGASRIIVPLLAIGSVNPAAGGYTNVTDAVWYLTWEGNGALATGAKDMAGQLALTDPFAFVLSGGQVVDGAAGGDWLHGSGDALAQLTNVPIKLRDDYASGGNYTGGHANNSGRITVVFLRFNTALGRFE